MVHNLAPLLPSEKIFLKHRVLKIAYNDAEGAKESEKMRVTVTNGTETEVRSYAAVINSTTLAALQKMDLTDMDLPYGMKTAIRSLRYDS